MSDENRSGKDAEPDDFVIDKTPVGRLPTDPAEQRDSVSPTMLVLLERLRPVQRAVFVLKEACHRSAGRRKPIVPVWLPGKASRAFRAGGNLTPDNATGTGTFEELLAQGS